MPDALANKRLYQCPCCHTVIFWGPDPDYGTADEAPRCTACPYTGPIMLVEGQDA